MAMELERGGRLIALNAPKGMTFGIDAMSYTVGEKFRGVQDIPQGLHFCHYSIGAGDEQQVYKIIFVCKPTLLIGLTLLFVNIHYSLPFYFTFTFFFSLLFLFLLFSG